MTRRPKPSVQDKWQRRLLTLSIMLVLGALAGWAVHEPLRDRTMIRAMGSRNHEERVAALHQAIARGAQRPDTLRRLHRALDTPDDLQFQTIALALRRLGQFHPPHVANTEIDRFYAIVVETPPPATNAEDADFTRLRAVDEIVAGRRDNAFTGRALQAALESGRPPLRHAAVPLAAHLRDEDALGTLLNDQSEIASAAAVAAGLAGLHALTPEIQGMLASDQPGRAAAGAVALALLQGPQSAPSLLSRLESTDEPGLAVTLLYALELAAAEELGAALAGVLASRDAFGPAERGLAMTIAARTTPAVAAEAARDVLQRTALNPSEVMLSELLGALAVAEAIDLEAGAYLADFLRTQWRPGPIEPALASAVRALVRQAPPAPDARDPWQDLLRQGALFALGGDGYETPMASAHAAAALWEMGAEDGDRIVRTITHLSSTLAGDVVAWRLSRGARRDDAFQLALQMVPPRSAAPDQDAVHNNNERSAGALLAAMSACTPEQADHVRARLADLLAARGLEAQSDPYVRGAYRAALAILGEAEAAEQTRRALAIVEFPHRRALTALLLAGDTYALDWLLANRAVGDGDLSLFLLGRGLNEVLAVTAPDLHLPDLGAPPTLMKLQLTLLRQQYLLQRGSIEVGPR